MVQYFAAGAKNAEQKRLGVEVEHFIVDSSTQEAVAYAGENGIRTVLSLLMAQYQNAVILP